MPTIALNGQQIFYYDSGGDQPAVVFLHGFLMDQTMFAPQINDLSSDYRCIAFDARGFGQTEWDGQPFSLYDTAADCVALLDALGIARAVIAGMSQGGYAALRIALRHPERVAGLILIDTRSGVDEELVQAGYRDMQATWRDIGPVDPMIDGLLTAIIGPPAQTGILWEIWKPRWKGYSGERIFHAMNNLLDRDDLSDAQLATISAPALVIHGEEDHGIPIANGEHLAATLPNSRGLVRIAGAAHASSLTHAAIANPAMRTFLEEVFG